MRSATRQHLEALLQAKKLDRTLATPSETRPFTTASTGVPALDQYLGGGWRRGELSELTGARSTGRTSVLMATLAAATAARGIVALVDAIDRFDPVSAAGAGVDLDRLLWVRGPALIVEHARPGVIDQAVRQAIRAFDLIVRAGGFGVVILDVLDIPPRYVRALPFTTWLRLAHANEGQATVALLAGEAPMGRSARGTSVRLSGTPLWMGESAQSRQFDGFQLTLAT